MHPTAPFAMRRKFLPSAALIILVLSTIFMAIPADAASKSKHHRQLTQKEAEQIALGKVPGGKVRSAELQSVGKNRFWSVDVMRPGKKNSREVHVDARTGKVLSVQTERPEDQAEEPLKGR
jgi:hypothetical protein